MVSNLVQLSYRPGIQRDGTKFQGDFCSDGQWVRFQRGVVKKMGGMKAPAIPAYINNLMASDISLYPYNGNIFYYIASSARITTGVIDNNFNNIGNNYNPLNPVVNGANILWQSEVVIQNNQRRIVFFGGNNSVDIAQNTASVLYEGIICTNQNLTLINNANAGIDPLINGGMVWSNPYLFLYGSNGLVQYSANNNPFNFNIVANNAASGGRFNISNDKVIYGRPIRAGSNAPAILFWTLSSVVRILNVGDQAVNFKIDVISNSSSILSSKCVVEYDGLFFWPGTDRFFLYNGVVQEMVNTTNLNYFFDNIDMAQRQKVFGVKNPKYGEIWWFYPIIGTQGNSKALIYNIRENSWYDTQIFRDAGFFSNDLGILATFGESLTVPQANMNYLWRHEFGNNETIQNGEDNLIASSITTPTFGWASFNPVRSGQGAKSQPIDRWVEIRRIEPDFKMNDPTQQISVIVNTQTYAQSQEVQSAPINFTGETGKIDMRVQGRQMSLTFTSGNYFEMGNIMMLLGIGDGQ